MGHTTRAVREEVLSKSAVRQVDDMDVRHLLRPSVVASITFASVIAFARADDHAHAEPAHEAPVHEQAAAHDAAATQAAKAEEPAAPTPDRAMAILRAGNARFVMGTAAHPHEDADRRTLTARNGQTPFASVLSCADSRVPAELLFDAGVGDLFVVRVAGNIACTTEIASLEYAADHLHTPLIVVMGHTKCGAVTAAVNHAELEGSLPALLAHIEPAAKSAKAEQPTLTTAELVPFAIRANVNRTMQDLLRRSPPLRALVADDKVKIVGAIYDIETGKVEWIGPHPQQAALLGATKPAADGGELVHGVAPATPAVEPTEVKHPAAGHAAAEH